MYPLSDENPNKNMSCAKDCSVFDVKAKINVSVASGAINRPTKQLLLLVLSVAKTRFYDSTKIRLQILGFLG